MRAFIVPAGTPAVALRNGPAMVEQDSVTTRREAMYFLEDVTVDPLGRVGAGPVGVTLGAAYAAGGWYGFRLPTNPRGYSTLLVRAEHVTIG